MVTTLSLLATMLQLTTRHYGFVGIEGLAGIIIGVIILIVICVILFKIMGLLLAKLGIDAAWTQIIYWLAVLLVFVLFLHLFGLY